MAEELKKPRQTTKSKPGKAEWDTAAVEIFINIYYQGSNIKGLNDAVRVALQVEGYGISLKQISAEKRRQKASNLLHRQDTTQRKRWRGEMPKNEQGRQCKARQGQTQVDRKLSVKMNDWMAPLFNNSYAVWKTPEMNLKLDLPPSVKPCKMPGRRTRHPTKHMKHRKHCWKSISHQVHKLRQKEQRYPDTRKRQKSASPKKGQKLRKIPGPATKVEAQKECGQASPRQGIWCQMSN